MAEAVKKDIITVHNRVSNIYKAIHVDGAYGGITPRGLLNLSFYSERSPIPKSTDFALKGEVVGDKIQDSPESLTGILREYEFGIYMDIQAAKAIVTSLNSKINDLENIIKQTQNATTKDK